MFKRLLITTSLLLSIALASCEDKDPDNQDDPVDTPTAKTSYLSGQITINGSPVENGAYTVSDYFSDATPDNGSFDMETVVFEGLPQIMMVTNNEGDIVMLNKSFDTNKVINEESTALALATLNPFFGHLKDDEYYEVANRVKATSSYAEYYDEVSKSIAISRNLFDSSNISLNNALSKVLSELFTLNEETIAKSRAIDGVVDDDETSPIIVTAEANTVCMRVKGLNPAYEVFVSHNNLAYRESKLVKSRSSYGITDLLKYAGEAFIDRDIANTNFTQGEATKVVLEEDGKYYFRLDRTTDAAIEDLTNRMICDALSSFSIPTDVKAEDLIEKLIMLNIAKDLGSKYIYNKNFNAKDVTLYVIKESVKHYIEIVIKNSDDIKLFGTKFKADMLNKLGAAVNSLTSLGQEVFRGYYGFNAPDRVNFQLCKQAMTIQDCGQHEIIILGGNNQEADPGTTLPLNLRVGIKAGLGNMVKFEVTSGGGSLENEVVKVSDKDMFEEYNVAETKWTLGTEGVQTVKAYIINQDGSFDPFGPSVKFTASFTSEGDYLMSVGDFVTFEYDSEGRPQKVSMKLDEEYSMTSSFSYDPMVIINTTTEYYDDEVEITTSTWSDFKFSDDGKRITSFKWVEDGDGGNVTIKYDPDDHIISIRDNATDGSTVTTFDWDVYGRLLKTHTVEIDDEWPEDLTLTYTYGDKEVECSSHMYPYIMSMEEPWFFMTGLFGDGPAYLPTGFNYNDKYEPDGNFHLNLKYDTSDNGKKISHEEIRGSGLNMILDYRYGSIEANPRSVSSGYDFASFPGFNKEKRKIRGIGHSHR